MIIVCIIINYNYCVYYEFFQINIVFELWFYFLLGMGGKWLWGGNGYGGDMTKGKNFMRGKWQKWYGGGNGYGGEMTRHRNKSRLMVV